MLGRRRPLTLAALAFVGLTALATSGCADQSAAARVGDRTLSESELLDEVRVFVDNETLLQAAGLTEEQLRGQSDASFSQSLVGMVLTQRVQFMLFDQLFDDEGLHLSAADLAAGRQQFQASYQDAATEFPQSYQDQAAEDYARALVLQDQLGDDGFQDAIRELVGTTEVEISSRYGTWDGEAFLAQIFDGQNASDPAVIPPVGPRDAPTSGSRDQA